MFKGQYPHNWTDIATACKEAARWQCIRCDHPHDVTNGYVLTVHHFNGDKSNCQWWNLLALCQRCHLHIQNKVDPETPWMFEHTEWLKPYVAGFYAWKYQNRELTREQATADLDNLLNLERIT